MRKTRAELAARLRHFTKCSALRNGRWPRLPVSAGKHGQIISQGGRGSSASSGLHAVWNLKRLFGVPMGWVFLGEGEDFKDHELRRKLVSAPANPETPKRGPRSRSDRL